MGYTEESAVSALQGDASLCVDELYLALGDCTLRLRSNSTAVLADLADYFSHVASAANTPDIDVIAIIPMRTCRVDAWSARCAPVWFFCRVSGTGSRPGRA